MLARADIPTTRQGERSGSLRWVLLAASVAMLAQVGCQSSPDNTHCCAWVQGNADWCGPRETPAPATTYPGTTTTTTTSTVRPCEHSEGTGDVACDQCLKGQCCSWLAACPAADLMTGQCTELGFCAQAHCASYCDFPGGGGAGGQGGGGAGGQAGGGGTGAQAGAGGLGGQGGG